MIPYLLLVLLLYCSVICCAALQIILVFLNWPNHPEPTLLSSFEMVHVHCLHSKVANFREPSRFSGSGSYMDLGKIVHSSSGNPYIQVRERTTIVSAYICWYSCLPRVSLYANCEFDSCFLITYSMYDAQVLCLQMNEPNEEDGKWFPSPSVITYLDSK